MDSGERGTGTEAVAEHPRGTGVPPDGEPVNSTPTDLIDTVMSAAEADPDLTDDARLLLLSALTGDDALQHELLGRVPDSTASDSPDDDVTPAGAFLRSVTVAGFRGIGPEARLDLHPAPGLVVVAGRNGSGKSTFSEAVEVALTRTSYRWSTKAAAWKAGWRNLHAGSPCRIRVELAEEGVGATTVGADWDADAELAEGAFWVQRDGQRRDTSDDPLGWAAPMEHYRPLLSYDELGGILEAEPSKLYDKLSAVLGLGPIAEAQERLDAQVKVAGEPRREARRLVKDLLEDLSASEDPRAAEAHTLLKARKPDMATIERLAVGVADSPSSEQAELSALANLTVPPIDDVRAVVAECERATEALARLSGTAASSLAQRIELLTHAVTHVESTGTGACPVCGVGTLDNAWTSKTRAEIAELKEQTSVLRTAQQAYQTALGKLRRLLAPVPPVLAAETDVELPGRTETADAWRAVHSVDLDTSDGRSACLDAYTKLAAQVAELRRAAEAERQKREDLWAPLATRLAEVAGALRQADDADQRGAIAKAAANWLKDHGNQLRNERLRPISEHAQRIWSELRQESNVDLGPIEVTGAKTRRKVELSARVDGQDAGALTVMSQGELHALALALFLPRATLPESPFQFVVVDDPVQAMDPAKVDGLARVLERISRSHQVIVFTHDDRLPEAIRYLGIDARILRVERAAGSQVTVANVTDPVERYLDDARAVALDPNADAEVLRRTIPLLCRLAVEYACKELFMARRYARGQARAAIEREWEDARTTRQAMALALRDNVRYDINPWLRRGSREDAAMRVIGRDGHHGLSRDALAACRDVEALIRKLRADAS